MVNTGERHAGEAKYTAVQRQKVPRNVVRLKSSRRGKAHRFVWMGSRTNLRQPGKKSTAYETGAFRSFTSGKDTMYDTGVTEDRARHDSGVVMRVGSKVVCQQTCASRSNVCRNHVPCKQPSVHVRFP